MEMLVVQLLILAALLLIVPFFAGGVFTLVEKGRGKRLFQWISGQLVIWVGIEVIAVLLLLRGGSFEKAMVLFWCYIAAVLCYSWGSMIRQRVLKGKYAGPVQGKRKRSFWNGVLWLVFAGVFLFQLVQVVLTYDAALWNGETNYFSIDTPFAMWIAFLGEVSGMSPVRVEQVVLPIVFLCMSYGVFYLLGAQLLVKKRVHHALLLVVLSVFAIGGEYLCRYYRPDVWENMRSKPEPVLLGIVLVPYLVLLTLLIGDRINKRKRLK